jgi:hypothetical protein
MREMSVSEQRYKAVLTVIREPVLQVSALGTFGGR